MSQTPGQQTATDTVRPGADDSRSEPGPQPGGQALAAVIDDIRRSSLAQHINAIVKSYSEILFFNSPLIGFLFFLITLSDPNIAISGIISVMAAYAFAKLINMDETFLQSGFYTYNPLLAGLAVGYLFKLSALTVFIVISAGIFTLLLSIMLNSFFYYNFRLPILSLPFAIVASIVYLASSNYAGLFAGGFYSHWVSGAGWYLPLWLSGFFKSLGTIFLLPYVIPGMAIAAVILCFSRILFMLAVAGYYTGTIATGLLTGSFGQAFANIFHFNYILIAMAIGGIFLVPSMRSYALAIVAVLVSTLLLKAMEVFWSYYGIPGFTIPFNFITLSFVYVLGIVHNPMIPKFIKSTPEETLDYFISSSQRFHDMSRTVALPFTGRWRVWQGFDGEWTHRGSWRHACDFIITDDSGSSHRNGGGQLADYYAFRKNILAPVRGRVVKAVSHLPDNPIGIVDKSNTWGNLVIISDERGFFVEISHFAQDSIRVVEGQWVEKGALLGKCGNSGYSPQPHIHIQVQNAEGVGAATLPFSFSNFLSDNKFFANGLPVENTDIESLNPEKNLESRLSFMLDDTFVYDVYRDGRRIDELRLKVKMAQDGTFYFDSGKGQLHFNRHEDTFYIYNTQGDDRYLKLIFMAIPKLPLLQMNDMSWCDRLPTGAVVSGPRRELYRFMNSFKFDFANVRSRMKYTGKTTIEGSVESARLGVDIKTFVELDGQVGFRRIAAGEYELRRNENEKIRK